MVERSRADEYLLDGIRRGSEASWSQLVERYQGRLVAYARGKLRQAAEAEDFVQETFLAFLKNPGMFRGESSLETFLFAILRRKIIDAYRGGKMSLCLLQDIFPATAEERHSDILGQLRAPDLTASWYARRDEERTIHRKKLAAALSGLIEGLKQSLNFRDLEVIEMIFYCQLRNKDIAQIAEVDEKQVALIKYRAIKQMQERIGSGPSSGTDEGFQLDDILSELWQTERFSCLKRSTLGSYLLGTLDRPWHSYVAFHLDRLGCRFCRANLEDLRPQAADETNTTLRNQILQSSRGFLAVRKAE